MIAPEGWVYCYCDPVFSVFLPDSFGTCPVGGCRAFQSITFILFFAMFAEGCRRLWIQREHYKTAIYISNSLLTFANLTQSIRTILLFAEVVEIYGPTTLFLFGIGFYFSAYLWILVSWCDIILSVNFSKTAQKVFPIVRWAIIFLTIMHFVGWIIAIKIWWPYQATNAWIASYGFGTSLGFLFLGFFIWREYKSVSSIAAHGDNAEKTYRKVKKVTRLSAYVVAAALLMTAVSFGSSYIMPKNFSGMLAWLFITRGTFIIFSSSTLIFLIPQSKKMNQSTSSSNKSSQWSDKMNKMEFHSNDASAAANHDLEESVGQTQQPTNKIVGISANQDNNTGSSQV
ncbi:hypothetical protein PPL_03382 [Heterostelium album PN500]|uniref:THH1/TOM1/TOM3 domain-containing protein n=1 Tax=Heterostelium pallidum (strain ATCC 26659 / Pp 5 / PN500) TaxID=670386 RepID=D3B4Q7_HETP5|nr:hypothetical protein PPL_03382 [Heterostelium album PN500]EFA84305.1 hypothetical protein PPL_03382 [Heterostelium album PN500]|eukprot:XP_020436420.1 hypothetical protein PPL_03382 [Heterostelium album PN500]